LNDTDQTGSYEIVTVLVRKTDYAELKRSGVPAGEQVAMALRHYLTLMEETQLVPQIFNGDVTTFRCSLPKELCDRLRSLGGRLDLHVMEAVRIWLL
jgi:hypothetical protein